jgi:hypothetical protein
MLKTINKVIVYLLTIVGCVIINTSVFGQSQNDENPKDRYPLPASRAKKPCTVSTVIAGCKVK